MTPRTDRFGSDRQDFTLKRLPDPVLRRKTRRVGGVSASERKTLEMMAKTMYLSQGVGLAANQVGLDSQMAVIDIGSGLIKMVNPVIIKKEGTVTEEEGCLSVPGVLVKVKRAKNIVVNYMNENGETVQMKADGLLARAIQHEVDHLSGRAIIDYINPIKRLFLKRKA